MNNSTSKQIVRIDHDYVINLIKQAFLYALPEKKELGDRVSLDSTIKELGIQSVSALEMAGFIEEKLDVQFRDDELMGISKLRDLADLIYKYTG